MNNVILLLQMLITVYPELQSLIEKIIQSVNQSGIVTAEELVQLEQALNAARQADLNSENSLENIITVS